MLGLATIPLGGQPARLSYGERQEQKARLKRANVTLRSNRTIRAALVEIEGRGAAAIRTIRNLIAGWARCKQSMRSGRTPIAS